MKPSLSIHRAVHLAAAPGDSLYVLPGYAARAGGILLEEIRAESVHFSPTAGRHYFTRQMIRRRSEDNGRSWRVREEWTAPPGGMREPGEHRHPLGSFLLPGPDVVVERCTAYTYRPDEPQFGLGNTIARTYRTLLRYSRDAGQTWSDWRQAIDARPGHDARHWAPGVEMGVRGGVGDGQIVLEDDHTVLMGFTIREPQSPPEDISERARELYSNVVCARGVWDGARGELTWTFGETIAVPFPEACGGCCEPALVRMTGGRWMMTMRCQGDAALKIPARRMAAISEDGGRSWGRPFALKYDDGTPVWMPASFHRFFVSSRTGRTYLIGNFLPGPVPGQTPRYPLALAEFDPARGEVIRATLRVIQDRPADAPEDRRYTNFGEYEDRETGELVLLLPEHPRHKNYAQMTEPSDYTGDNLMYRITL